jgi:hypothetical protein
MVITHTPTSTPTASHHCKNPAPYPNPCHGCSVAFRIDGGPYDQVTLTLYTTNGRQVFHKTCNSHECEFNLLWDAKDNHQTRVCNGLYYAHIETACHGEVCRYQEKVVILN